jgi:site-specific DNA-methyltransferase (adenine-specific)
VSARSTEDLQLDLAAVAAAPAVAAPARARRPPVPRRPPPPPRQVTAGDQLLPQVLDRLDVRHRHPMYALILGDAADTMNALPSESVDLIFADPPYRLSNGGTTCWGGGRVRVDKGEWDESHGLDEDHAFNVRWLRAAHRVLKQSGTLWVSGTHHIIFSIGYAMQEIGFHLINTISWHKPNATPNLSGRMFAHSTEFLIWAAPARLDPMPHVFHYDEMREENGDKQMRDLWEICPPHRIETSHGVLEGEEGHPTQKPIELLDRIVRATSDPGQLVLDPFNGSGTTGVASLALGRRYIGIDLEARWIDLTQRRIETPLDRR